MNALASTRPAKFASRFVAGEAGWGALVVGAWLAFSLARACTLLDFGVGCGGMYLCRFAET